MYRESWWATYSSWGCKESDMTEQQTQAKHFSQTLWVWSLEIPSRTGHIYPLLVKVFFNSFHFNERFWLVPVFPNHNKFKEDFSFMKKGKTKKRIQHLFLQQGVVSSASSHHNFEQFLWASGLYFYLFCASFNMLCPGIITSLLYGFWLKQDFLGKLSDKGGNPGLKPHIVLE